MAPEGYSALGDVFLTTHWKPSLEDVGCMRSDLVGDGVVDE
ncbi:Vps62-related protein [Rhizobium sp. PL01]